MEWWLLLLLALVQGLTEFWPVSSSAHLVLVPHLLGTPDQHRSIDVALHLGTLLALLVYYRRECLDMLGAVGNRCSAGRLGERNDEQWRWFLLLVVASIPIATLGGWVAQLEIPRAPVWVGWASLGFGLLLGLSAMRKRFVIHKAADISMVQALLVGGLQVLALMPGVSRSGIVLTACLLLGMIPRLGVRFALLLGVPAIAGAVLWELAHLPGSIWQYGDFWLAAGLSGVIGLAGIGILVGVVERLGVWPFVVYRLLLSGAILLIYTGA